MCVASRLFLAVPPAPLESQLLTDPRSCKTLFSSPALQDGIIRTTYWYSYGRLSLCTKALSVIFSLRLSTSIPASSNALLIFVVVMKLRLEYDIVALRATRDIVDVVNIACGSANRLVSLAAVSFIAVCLYQRIKVVVAWA